MGKTNMAELAGDYQSTNSLFPRVNNPWNLDYTPGGSSGGSAAAVAAGLSPLDLGNDFAGSVRQPAHFCGVYGLKPTDRRSLTQLFRTATQGDRSLRKLGDFSRLLPELLNPSLKGYFQVLTERDRFTAQLDRALEPWDVWLTPVAATVAFTHCPAWSAVDIDGKLYPHAVANGAYTMPFNLSGHPAVIIPIGQTQNGLPIGIQIVGKRWREMELLAIAQEIDRVVGRFQRPPGY
jgi:Asp-tRNA(Asn)/Glu-tRNA(Gln) amidotransferase A subunit family amidase